MLYGRSWPGFVVWNGEWGRGVRGAGRWGWYSAARGGGGGDAVGREGICVFVVVVVVVVDPFYEVFMYGRVGTACRYCAPPREGGRIEVRRGGKQTQRSVKSALLVAMHSTQIIEVTCGEPNGREQTQRSVLSYPVLSCLRPYSVVTVLKFSQRRGRVERGRGKEDPAEPAR